ncbi:MAG: alkyldihydroxyacetonephosphate synthase [Thermoleophilia bacterium]|nr:alkyldihydroxyacetonephosphate synthase [Thermoleophilia bacterium]
MTTSRETGRARDPLGPELRAARLASWGPVTERAAHLAHRLVDRYEHVTEGEVAAAGRSHLHAQRTPPSIDPGRLSGVDIDALARLAPVHTDDGSRRAYSLGKSWPDLVAARGGHLDRVCDAVVRPRTEDELERALAWCVERDVAVVPVGGGTSVAGGIEPLGRTASQPVVALDVTALATCLDIDEVSGVATFQAGVRGPDLERALAPYGLTLGHVPQSFEYSTLGGWIATRSAGQQSLRYGKMESMVAALRLVTPSGVMDVPHVPAHGAGSDLRELVLGSEGTLGVVTRATVRIRRRPEVVRFAAYVLPSFDAARDAARLLVQRGDVRPAMVRVSDAAETAFNVGSSVPKLLGGSLGRGLARVLGARDGALVLVLSTGTSEEARATERIVDRHMSRCGGRAVGAIPAKAWYHGRFTQPYARDVMMDRGLLVDTLETSATWARLPALHAQVRAALEGAFGSGRCMVGAHLSHLYHDGASAYFTFLASPTPGRELEQWRAAKLAVHAAIARCGGATSHQHGVGTMHADLFEAVTPGVGAEAIRAVRSRLDPAGTCNPGKLLERPADGQRSINAVRVAPPGTDDAARTAQDQP